MLKRSDTATVAASLHKGFSRVYAYQLGRGLRKVLGILGEPIDGIQFPVPPDARSVTATELEIQSALAVARPADRLLILLCADCGLRTGEAVRLAPANWNREQHTITFPAKRGVERTMPVTERVEALFASAPELGEMATPFFERFAGRRFHNPVQNADHRWQQIKKATGIRPELNLHDLRRTLATKAYRSTKDLILVQQLLGHKNLRSTLHYIAPHDSPNIRPLLERLRVPTRGEIN